MLFWKGQDDWFWFVCYHAVFEASGMRATPGKAILGMQVSRVDGDDLTFLRAFARSLLRFVVYYVLPLLFFTHLIQLFTERRQRLLDMITGTVVTHR